MNGVQAEGVRVTRTIAAGSIGNDKPIDVVTERWYSPDLQIAVLTIHSDPDDGNCHHEADQRDARRSRRFDVPSPVGLHSRIGQA